ncbi:MAG: hypothetical protein ABR963_03665 [Acidimicrobiales bacterium]
MPTKRAYLEVGKKSVFVLALDWPGWARRSTTPERAVEELTNYQERYEKIVGHVLPAGKITIVGSVAGNATTDFGAPGVVGPWDEKPDTKRERLHQVELLERCWNYFDEVVAKAPNTLTKGPRGGGRDRDQIVDHVRETERAYAPKMGLRIPPRTAWSEQRSLLSAQLRAGYSGQAWPQLYAVRRLAWHVVDHAWEIEDKSTATTTGIGSDH